jgi:apolipoprotein N-acyltransferase
MVAVCLPAGSACRLPGSLSGALCTDVDPLLPKARAIWFLLAPVFWVALEYVRSFLLTGFPWGIVGYSQFNRLHIIQISDMFGVYGISFLGGAFQCCRLCAAAVRCRKALAGHPVDKWQALGAIVLPLLLIGFVW